MPQYSNIQSRGEIDIGNNLGDITLRIPVIASPMDTVSGPAMAEALHKAGCVAIIHRYNTPAEQARMILDVRGEDSDVNVGLAVGVTGDYLMRAKLAKKVGTKLLCIDVAHGHHVLVERAIKTIRDSFGEDFYIVAGNVATLEGFNDLADWGADKQAMVFPLCNLFLIVHSRTGKLN